MFSKDLSELTVTNLMQMHVLFYFAVQTLSIAYQVLLYIRQLVQSSLVESKNCVQFMIDVFVDSFVDKANEHIPVILAISVFKNDIGVPMSLPKDQFLYDMSLFSWTCARQDYKFTAVFFSLCDLQFGSDEIPFFLYSTNVVDDAIIVRSHAVKLFQFLENHRLLHIKILNIVDMPVLNIVLHTTDSQLSFFVAQSRYFLPILLDYLIDEGRQFELYLLNPRVNHVEWIARVIVRIHLELDKTSRDQSVDHCGRLMVLEDKRVSSDRRREEKVHSKKVIIKWVYIRPLSGALSLTQVCHHKFKSMLILLRRHTRSLGILVSAILKHKAASVLVSAGSALQRQFGRLILRKHPKTCLRRPIATLWNRMRMIRVVQLKTGFVYQVYVFALVFFFIFRPFDASTRLKREQ